MPKGQKLKVIDTSNLTDADWAAIERVNRACELGGSAAFWHELESFDDLSLQLRVVGAFFPDVISEMIEEEMTEHDLTMKKLRKALKLRARPRAGTQK